MRNNDGRQEYGIFLDNTQLRANVSESKNMLRGIGDTAVAESSRIDSAYKKAAGAAVALFSVAAIKQFGMELINITGQFQTFEAVLTNTLQSPAKAKEAMNMLQNFAATTPFQVDALTGAFVKLANQGFVPTYAEMTKLGDLASSTGKGFDQLAEAIIDAQTGEFERLKEFGIRASKDGDAVTFTFKEQQTQVDFTASSIRDYVLSLGELKGVQGANAQIAKTLTGQVSNLQDGITQMMNEIGQSSEGVLSGILSGTSLLVENYETVGSTILNLIAVYGTYRAALITINALQSLNNRILRQAVLEKKLAAMAGVQLSSSQAVAAASTKMLSIAQQGLAKSIKAVGAAMIANPYALIAAAIAGIGYVIYKVLSAQTEFEKAQERLREANKEVNQEFTSEIRQLNALERKLSEAKQGSEEYKAIKDEIVKNYGKYYEGLDKEIEKVGNLSTAYDTLVEKIRLSIGARKFESFFKTEQENVDKIIAETLDTAYERLTEKYGKDKGLSLYKEFFNNIQHGTALSMDALAAFRDTNVFDMRWGDNAVDGVVDFRTSIDQMRTDIRKSKQASNQAIEDFKDVYQITEEQMTEILLGKKSSGTPEESSIASSLKEVIKEIKEAEATLSEMRTKAQQGLISDDDVKKQEEKVKKLKESYKTKTDKNYDEKPTKKDKPKDYTDQLAKDAQAQARLEVDFEHAVRQAEINAKDEGLEKVLAQNQLNFDKEKEQINRQKADMLADIQNWERNIWEAQNPNWEKEGKKFTPKTTTLSDKQLQGFGAQEEAASKKMQTANKTALDAMLSNYLNYEQRRQEVNSKFDADENQIKTSSILSESDKNAAIIELTKKRQEAVKTINNEELEDIQKSSDLFVRLFSDASQQSVKQLRNIISTTEELLRYLETTSSKDITPKFGFTAEELKTIKESPEKLKALRDAIKDLNGELGSRSPFEKFANDIDKAIEKIKSGDFGGGLEGIGGAVQAIMPTIKQFGEDLGTIFGDSQIGEDIGILTELIGGVGKGIQGIGQIASGDILGGVTSIVSGIASIFSMANEAARRHREALEAVMNSKIAQQREYNLLLMQQNLLYERGTTIFGSDGYGKAVNAIEVYKQALADLSEAMAGNDAQKKSQRGRNHVLAMFGIKDAQSALKQIYAGLADIEIVTGHKKTGLFGWGKGKDTYSSVLNVYPDLIKANGDFNKELAQTIIQTRKMSDADKESLQNMINLYEQYEEAMQQVRDYLTSIFGELGNTMSDALVDAFKNGSDAAKAFTDSVSDMLENLAKQMIYSVTLAPIMEKAQEQMLEVMKNGNLTDAQKFEQYAAILSNLTNDALAQQNTANALYKQYQDMAAAQGIDIFKPDEEQREASKRGIATASQESVDENNGRLTAIQGHTFLISESVKLIQPDVAYIKEAMNYMRGNAAEQLKLLQGIESNTAPISEIKTELGYVKSALETIRDKGVVIKK